MADIYNNSISLLDHQDYTNSTFGVARNTRVGNFVGTTSTIKIQPSTLSSIFSKIKNSNHFLGIFNFYNFDSLTIRFMFEVFF